MAWQARNKNQLAARVARDIADPETGLSVWKRACPRW